MNKPRNVGLRVAEPDDQVLRKHHVRPHHQHRQQQFAEVVNALGRRDCFELALMAYRKQREDDPRDGAERFAGDDDQAKDAGHPVRLTRHNPIDADERYREKHQHHAALADVPHAIGETQRAGIVGSAILFDRRAPQRPRERDPDDECDRHAEENHQCRKIRPAMHLNRIVRPDVGIRPRIKIVAAQQ